MALKVGLAIDCIDVLSTTACYLGDGLPATGALVTGGGAVVLALMGWGSLRAVERALAGAKVGGGFGAGVNGSVNGGLGKVGGVGSVGLK